MKCFYLVKPNDTILSICEKFGVEPNELMKMNHMQNYNIKRGDFLEIPSVKKR